jgi:ketosteroid isomerase-like protein
LTEPTAEQIVTRFNDMINARDLDGLAALLSVDHRFVDSAGNPVVGKDDCIDAWRGFFAAFPAYRNEFDSVRVAGGTIVVSGHSYCPGHPELEGPALWTASVDRDLVSEWRVYDDTPQTRELLGLNQPRETE